MKSSKSFTTTWCVSALFAVTSGIASARQPDVCKAKEGRERPAVDYQVQGGLTGGLTNWLIYSDGVVCELSGRTTLNERGRIPKDKVTDLVDELGRMGFFALAEGHGCRGSICIQCKSYRVTLRSGTHKHTVQACDEVAKTPQVADILFKIQQVIAREIQ